MSSELIKMTHEEYMAKGKELFGDDMMKWKFKCPACGHVQTPGCFRKYKEQGANPNDAYFNCIGRFSGGEWLGRKGESTSPCNYTSGGFLTISPIEVELPGGDTVRAFDFADPNEEVGDDTPKQIRKKRKRRKTNAK